MVKSNFCGSEEEQHIPRILKIHDNNDYPTKQDSVVVEDIIMSLLIVGD